MRGGEIVVVLEDSPTRADGPEGGRRRSHNGERWARHALSAAGPSVPSARHPRGAHIHPPCHFFSSPPAILVRELQSSVYESDEDGHFCELYAQMLDRAAVTFNASDAENFTAYNIINVITVLYRNTKIHGEMQLMSIHQLPQTGKCVPLEHHRPTTEDPLLWIWFSSVLFCQSRS